MAASQIRNIGLDAANLLVEGCKKEEVENELEGAIRETENIVEKCQSDAREIIKVHLNEMRQKLDVIENSEFSN